MSRMETIALNVMIWACVFPSVLAFSYLFRWLDLGLPHWVEIGVSTALSVPLISTVCIPRVEKALAAARHETPAELKMRQAEAAEGPDPRTIADGATERPLHRDQK
ncbi:hypothetical protein [Roseitranquillus sediminis]|uniref:hypothetical protein n=1 Tax=Roseitranquillus sediminis TaxID=2809051 RepID=UPI001D0C581F|nr:hypothetical protein [Roseitranquillus sediminis]MBM9594106.1 hypothetical protein [Roseitranquillus sediminis]